LQAGLKAGSRIALAALFVGAGAMHFTNSPFFEAIVPPYVPYPVQVVYISGVCEIFGGIGLLLPSMRKFACYGLVALLIAVFPANVHMAINDIQPPGMPPASPLLLWLRLPLQYVLICWVLWAAEPSDSTVAPA